VTKRFGGLEALKDVNLEVREQGIQSIIGPNGAGKTTFFNCVTGFYTPKWRDPAGWSQHHGVTPTASQAGIARTYQNIRLFKI
jgi:branched-chain amino acid transport system ATP-binding protein